MINRLLTLLPALALGLLVQAAQAQAPSQPPAQSKPQSQPPAKSQPEAQGGFLYKSTMPDGKVRYGDKPEPGAVKVEKTRPDTSKKGITAATDKEMAAAKRLEAERTAGAASPGGPVIQAPGAVTNPDAISTADLQEMLRKMEAGREKFREPVEGERIGTVSGGGRFTDGYLERQNRYDQSIEAVRKELAKRSSR